MTSRVLIMADDLTGALDSSVGFAGAGRIVVVARSPGAVPEALAASPDVLAVNTASREIAPEAAARRVEEALAHLDRNGFAVVMKKIDSRLKGNISAETEVLAAWAGIARRIMCPAIPAMGRQVVAGALIGAGIIAPIPVAARFDGHVEVPQARSDADLDALTGEGIEDVLWIGARGLAFALARRLGVSAPATAFVHPPLMIANGSRDPITRAQIAALPATESVIDAPNGVAPDFHPPAQSLVLSITTGEVVIPGREAARRFAESLTAAAGRFRPTTLIICGGESAQTALDRLGVNSLQVEAELRPGLPLFRIETAWGPVRVATKSGGFGAPDLFTQILEDAARASEGS